MLQPTKKIPSPDEILGNSKIPSPQDILGEEEVKKKDNLESSGATPQEVSPTPITPRKSLLGTESQKKPLVSGGSVGKLSDIKEFTGFNKKDISSMSNPNAKKIKPLSESFPNRVFKPSEKVIKTAEQVHKNYVEKTYITPDENAKLIQKVDDEFNKKGIVNGLIAGVKQGYNAIADFTTHANPFTDATEAPESIKADVDIKNSYVKKANEEYQLALKDYNSKKSKNPNDDTITKPEYNPEDIQKRAREIAINDKKSELINEKTHDFMSNLSEEDKKSNEFVSKIKYNSIKEEDLSLKNATILSKKAYADSNKKLNQYIVQINELKEKNQDIPQDLQNNIQEEVNKNDSYKETYLHTSNQYNEKHKDLGNVSDELDLFSRDYGTWSNILGDTQAFVLNAASGIAGHGAYMKSIQRKIDKAVGFPLVKTLGYLNPLQHIDESTYTNLSEKIKKSEEEVSSGMEKPVEVSSAFSSLHNFGKFVEKNVVDVVGMGVQFSNPAGIASFVSASSGNKYNEMVNSNKKGLTNYTDAQLMSLPGVYGAIDDTIAVATENTVKGASRVYRSATNAEKDIIAEGLFDATFKQESIGSKILKDQVHSAKTMGGLQIAKNASDILIGGDKDKHLLDGVGSAIATGSLIVIGAHLKGGAPKLVKDVAYNLSGDGKIRKISDKIDVINTKLEDINISDETRDVLKSNLDVLHDNLKNVLVKNAKDVKSLSDKQFKELVDKSKKTANIRSQAESIKSDPSLSKEEAQDLLDLLREQHSKSLSRTKELLDNGAQSQFERLPTREQSKLLDEANKQLIKENNPDGTREYNVDEKEAVKRAINIKNEREFKESIPVDETEKPNQEKNVFYFEKDSDISYNENGMPIVPEGYSTVKKVENSKEVELLKEQNGTETKVNKSKGTEDVISEPIELEVKPTETKTEKEAKIETDYKLPQNSDVNNMTVVENDGEFLIGEYTEKTGTSNPVLKPVSDLENNPLSFNSKQEAQAKLDEIKKPIEIPKVEAKPTEEVKVEEPTPTKTRRKTKPVVEEVKPTEEVKVEEPKAEETKQKEKVSLPTEAVDKMKELLKDEKQQKAILKKLIAEGRIRKIC